MNIENLYCKIQKLEAILFNLYDITSDNYVYCIECNKVFKNTNNDEMDKKCFVCDNYMKYCWNCCPFVCEKNNNYCSK